jgi:dipeptidyl aminopeptidase/acylaminoacyl peptidase
MNLDTMEFSERLFGHPSFDARGVILSRKKEDRGRILGFTYIGKYFTRYYIDPDAKAFHDGISALFPEQQVSIASRARDDNEVVIFTRSPKNPGAYYLLRNKTELLLIGKVRPLLSEDMLSDVKFISYEARDGMRIRAYVTLPSKGQKPYPTVIMPHGGPWARDSAVFDDWAQFLAHNGYMVVQPQFRGSQGIGLELWMAGDEKWGLEMQDDLDDAANFLLKNGLADPDRIAMHGYSYGGYAAFVASFRENGPYKCSIAGAGVADMNDVSAELSQNRFLRELQRPTIKGLNPIDHTQDVRMPILVMHGDRDTIVHVKHSRGFVDGLEKHNKIHKYVELKGMRHQAWTWTYQHRRDYYSNMLDWLENSCF